MPVFTSARTAELHYSGYCKSVLSPLFHSVPFSTDFHINTHDSEEPDDNEERMWQVRHRVKLRALPRQRLTLGSGGSVGGCMPAGVSSGE